MQQLDRYSINPNFHSRLVTLVAVLFYIAYVAVPNIDARIVKLTYYWIAVETDYPSGSDVSIKECTSGQVIAKVSSQYWSAVHMEGTGKLRDGSFITCNDDSCHCYGKAPYPVGAWDNPIKIYSSLAANDIPPHTRVFVKQLQGVKLPNKQVHNGCFEVDDQSWSFGSSHVDWYVYREGNYKILDQNLNGLDSVDIEVGSNCQLLAYEEM